jgi:DNA-binding MarR family transcriptional regulator
MTPATTRQLQATDYQQLLAFRTELRDFLRWSENAAHNAGVTPSLHQLLLVIRGHPAPEGPTISQAAELLHIRHHSAVEITQRAEEADLIERTRAPTDHRQVHLKLTGHGHTQLETLTREHLPRIRALADTLERVTHPDSGHDHAG